MLARQAWFRSPHPLHLRLLVCPSTNRAQDISNRIKVLEDALKNGNVFVDDCQVDVIEVRRGPVIKHGVIYVRLVEILPDYQENLRWIQSDL